MFLRIRKLMLKRRSRVTYYDITHNTEFISEYIIQINMTMREILKYPWLGLRIRFSASLDRVEIGNTDNSTKNGRNHNSTRNNTEQEILQRR